MKTKSLLLRSEISSIKTIVVKTGSRILTATGHEARVKRLIDDLVALHNAGIRVVLVSSGAIAHGMKALGLTKRPSNIPMQQACASIGQNRLMNMYEKYFEEHNILIGQVLLTWDDLRSKKRYLNLRNTFFQLLDSNVIPIVNENDSVGVEEIQFGNNDTLGAQIALLTNADIFVNLTDVGGLYDKNPHTDKTAKHIPVVTQFSSYIHKLVSEKKTEISVGGMSTKLKAAETVTRAGIHALIGDGYDQRLSSVLSDDRCATLFVPSDKKMSSRHRWIAYTGQACGKIIVDNGALNALTEKGKSLLPAGVKGIHGTFKAGDKVEIVSERNTVIGSGLVNYSSDDADLLRGCRTSEISQRIGHKSFDEIIHRNNLVIY
ncbi:MAG: glutamate 5-kinase [Fibrobacter sp.]|nr:glutamate 5-kinase [Fibrobacter sp.]